MESDYEYVPSMDLNAIWNNFFESICGLPQIFRQFYDYTQNAKSKDTCLNESIDGILRFYQDFSISLKKYF